jgi:REP element-mobilizing transposase RayT
VCPDQSSPNQVDNFKVEELVSREMKQLEFKKVNGWGGRRKGAGRKNVTGTVSHGKRARVDFKKPLHLTAKVKKNSINLRTRQIFNQLKKASSAASQFGLNAIHFALLSNHLHLIVEARDNEALERGMKSLNGRLGKFLAGIAGRRVWNGRFHMHVLKSPTEMKNALKYVLLNFSKHERLIEHLDHFSSGRAFTRWRELLSGRLNGLLKMQNVETSIPLSDFGLSPPRSWLAREGWTRAPN